MRKDRPRLDDLPPRSFREPAAGQVWKLLMDSHDCRRWRLAFVEWVRGETVMLKLCGNVLRTRVDLDFFYCAKAEYLGDTSGVRGSVSLTPRAPTP